MLYGRFENADRQTRELVTRAIQDRSALIAGALAPTLRTLDLSNASSLNTDLARYGSDETTLKLLFQPAGSQPGSGQQPDPTAVGTACAVANNATIWRSL